MNDYEGLFGLEDIIYEIKFIIRPSSIRYKHHISDEAEEKFNNYLKINNFSGKIFKFIIKEESDDNRLIKHPKNIIDSGEVIFNFLQYFRINKEIKIYNLYINLDDNSKINKKILNANININFKEDYDSYIEKVIEKKRNQNIKNMAIHTYDRNYILQNLEILKETSEINKILYNKRCYIYQKYNLLFKNNNVYWHTKNNSNIILLDKIYKDQEYYKKKNIKK